MTAVGVVAFSFGLRAAADEPGPANARLARATERIVQASSPGVLVVAQWEVALGMRAVSPTLVVELRADGTYLDSEGVWAAAVPLFRDKGVTAVVPVAQPWLHSAKVRRMIARDGFVVVRRRVGWIGFDASIRNTQWWTRGPVRLGVYALAQAFTGRRGH